MQHLDDEERAGGEFGPSSEEDEEEEEDEDAMDVDEVGRRQTACAHTVQLQGTAVTSYFVRF